MRVHDFLGRAGKESLIEKTGARPRAVKEIDRCIMRSGKP